MRATRRRRYRRRHRAKRTAQRFRDLNVFVCWCGARGTLEEMFSPDPYSDRCGGTGHLDCFCGGDFCVCHNHGEVECPGCPDCEGDDDDYMDDGFDQFYDVPEGFCG